MTYLELLLYNGPPPWGSRQSSALCAVVAAPRYVDAPSRVSP